jgi:hypothetical protein
MHQYFADIIMPSLHYSFYKQSHMLLQDNWVIGTREPHVVTRQLGYSYKSVICSNSLVAW